MMNKKLNSWNPADQLPTANGVYEVRESLDWPFAVYAKFVNGVWHEQKNSIEDAENSSKNTHHLHEWRQVVQN